MRRETDSSIRRMLVGKMDRRPLRNGFPMRREGADGDLGIYATPEGLKSYMKRLDLL